MYYWINATCTSHKFIDINHIFYNPWNLLDSCIWCWLTQLGMLLGWQWFISYLVCFPSSTWAPFSGQGPRLIQISISNGIVFQKTFYYAGRTFHSGCFYPLFYPTIFLIWRFQVVPGGHDDQYIKLKLEVQKALL